MFRMASRSIEPDRGRPLIRRSPIYDILPQMPGWFLNSGHVSAKVRFLRKLKREYKYEQLDACPWCGGSRFSRLANQERSGLPTSVMMCHDCALVFTNPRIDTASTADHYESDYRGIERGSLPDLHRFMFNLQGSKGPIIWDFLRSAHVIGQPKSKVTDIGCGEGGLIQWFAKNTDFTEVSGFELNRSAAAYGCSMGLDVRTREFVASDELYDLVLIEQVLEHIAEPRQLLAAVAKSQRPGAWLFIGVPGILNFSSHYDDNFLAYLQYGHLFHYSLHTVERVVVSHGYRLVHGDETVRAVFQRTDGEVPAPITPILRAEEVTTALQKSERKFRSKGSQLWRERDAYYTYARLLTKAWLSSLGGGTNSHSSVASRRNNPGSSE
jgi:2-polyprenyl-3-methyl-5-hydroxy-6-metoxy-1,4-benzoquinol methylase